MQRTATCIGQTEVSIPVPVGGAGNRAPGRCLPLFRLIHPRDPIKPSRRGSLYCRLPPATPDATLSTPRWEHLSGSIFLTSFPFLIYGLAPTYEVPPVPTASAALRQIKNPSWGRGGGCGTATVFLLSLLMSMRPPMRRHGASSSPPRRFYIYASK